VCFSFPCMTLLSTDNSDHSVLLYETPQELVTFACVTVLHKWRHASFCASCLPLACVQQFSKCGSTWQAQLRQSLPMTGCASACLVSWPVRQGCSLCAFLFSLCRAFGTDNCNCLVLLGNAFRERITFAFVTGLRNAFQECVSFAFVTGLCMSRQASSCARCVPIACVQDFSKSASKRHMQFYQSWVLTGRARACCISWPTWQEGSLCAFLFFLHYTFKP
jgi:hypothetical protein